MNKLIRSLLSRLAVAAALVCAPFWAAAADVTLAAITPSQSAAEGRIQEMGRIEAASGYDASVWRQLAHARHPDMGSASPRRLAGKVDVKFEVAPNGSLAQAAITQSSLSNALDGAALRAVQRARFQPLAADAETNVLPRRYHVTFDYRY